MDPAALNQLSPEQRQAVLMQIQQKANQEVMAKMTEDMVAVCFKKCAGTSVSEEIFFTGVK